ncbi:MAG: hypothetical protein LBJ92_01755 [Holosporales bacterium]|nr:hypothetical protein [Holosporales bacterium]
MTTAHFSSPLSEEEQQRTRCIAEKQGFCEIFNDGEIPNGSLAITAGLSFFNDTTRSLSRFKHRCNPLGISHVLLVINDYPSEIIKLIEEKMQDTADPDAIVLMQRMIENIRDKVTLDESGGDILIPFVFEADTTCWLCPLTQYLDGERNLYLRLRKRDVQQLSLEYSRNFVRRWLCVSYPFWMDSVRLVACPLGRNSPQYDYENIFCSELVALFCNIANASNVVPSEFSSTSGPEHDLVRDMVEPDVPVMLVRDFSPAEANGLTFTGSLLRGSVNTIIFTYDYIASPILTSLQTMSSIPEKTGLKFRALWNMILPSHLPDTSPNQPQNI